LWLALQLKRKCVEMIVNNGVNKKTVLFVAALSSFIVTFMGSAINIALPSIGRELRMDAVSLGWVASSFLLATAVFLLPFGRLADIRGRKKILTYGLFVYTVASLILSFTTSGSALIALRAVQGVGAAMMAATGIAILTSVFPVGERGRALGISIATTYLGLSLGPVLGGLLTQHLGWRSIFLVTVALGAVIIGFVLVKMKGEWAEAEGEKFDIAGALVYGFALTGIIYGFSMLPGRVGIWLVAAGAAGIVAFVRREMKVESPILNIGLFRDNRIFAFSNLAALINYSATFAVAFLLSLYLQYIKGFSPQDAGLVLVAMPAVQASLSPLAGRLSDRFQPRTVASTGMGLTVTGLALLISLNANTSLSFIIVSLVILGCGFAFFSSPNANAIMSSVDHRFYGVASATLATMRQVGQTFSLGIAILLFAIYIGRVEITPGLYPLFLSSVKIAFIIFTALCSVGVFASLARGKR
jgi:EmrB/QacA subfamily drug resistance transporter